MKNSERGIIWVGPVYENGGYGQVSRSFVLELRRQGVPLRIVPTGQPVPQGEDFAPGEAEALQACEQVKLSAESTAVIHSSPDGFPSAPRPDARRTVGYTIAETDRIPGDWAARCNQLDEVWIPTEFNRATFTRFGVDDRRVRVIPYGVDVSRLDRLAGEQPAPAPTGEFVFLYVCAFDFRKGVDLLIDAYLREFRRGEAVRLKIKTWVPPYAGIDGTVAEWVEAEFGSRLPGGAPVEIVEGYTSTSEMVQLYREASLYITTDRANGWGMPPMEAMALGRPAATIDWSGSTQFMKAENSVLIRPTGRLVPVDPRLSGARPELYAEHQWAEVVPEEVQRAMRSAFEAPETLARLGQAGRETMLNELSLEAATRRLVAAALN